MLEEENVQTEIEIPMILLIMTKTGQQLGVAMSNKTIHGAIETIIRRLNVPDDENGFLNIAAFVSDAITIPPMWVRANNITAVVASVAQQQSNISVPQIMPRNNGGGLRR